MDITPYRIPPARYARAKALVLEAIPVGHGQTATLHEITAQVREEFPQIPPTSVAGLLLVLSADGKVRFIGDGECRRYARRV